MKVYLDTNIVIAIGTGDTPDELGPLLDILEAHDSGKLELFTSNLLRTEIDKYRGSVSIAVRAVYLLLKKVPTTDPHKLVGISHGYGTNGTWFNAPIFEETPLYAELRKLGVKEVDARHLLSAIEAKCDAFLTCDGGVLHRGPEIKSKHAVLCSRPSTFSVP